MASVVRGCLRMAAGSLVAALLASCGGSDGASTNGTNGGAIPQRASLKASAQPLMPTVDQALDWAERVYPDLFAAAAQPTGWFAPYQYRYYPATGNHLGIAGNEVWMMGPMSGGQMQYIGDLRGYACQIVAQDCPSQDLFAASGYETIDASIGFPSPSQVTATLNTYGTMPDQVMYFTTSGDPTAVAGQTLYVFVEDPAGLISGTPQVLPSGGDEVAIRFSGRQLFTAGVHTGALRFHFCLDAQCSRRFAGSPVSVPYRVTVNQGVAIAPSVSASTLYAVDSQPLLLPMRAKPGTSLAATGPNPAPFAIADKAWLHTAIQDVSTDGSRANLALSFDPIVPGNYSSIVTVWNDNSFTAVRVNYEVKPNTGQLASFTPNVLQASVPCGTQLGVGKELKVSWAGNDTLIFKEFRYVDANGQRIWPPFQWLWGFGGSASQTFTGSNTIYFYPCNNVCLPVGTHYAQMVYEYPTNPGRLDPQSELVFPVRFTITP